MSSLGDENMEEKEYVNEVEELAQEDIGVKDDCMDETAFLKSLREKGMTLVSSFDGKKVYFCSRQTVFGDKKAERALCLYSLSNSVLIYPASTR